MLDKRNPQLNKNGELIHLLSPEGLSRDILTHILDTANNFVSVNDREIKKLPLLRGKSVFNLFFENSTRTRTTFDIAAKRLSADVFTLDIGRSSTAKGETLLDTIDNLSAMAADIFVVRHSESGAPYLIAKHVAPHVHVVNAGDGRHAHPTQGLLDAYTIRHYKKDFTNLRVAIVGDVLHSRVARSDIHALTTLGAAEVRVVGPRTLVPSDMASMGVRVFHNLEEGIKDCDVIIMLRLQNERMSGALLPSSQEYFKSFGLTEKRLELAKPDAIVMHPGPINRGVEIDSAVVDGPQAVILSQVTFGIAVQSDEDGMGHVRPEGGILHGDVLASAFEAHTGGINSGTVVRVSAKYAIEQYIVAGKHVHPVAPSIGADGLYVAYRHWTPGQKRGSRPVAASCP